MIVWLQEASIRAVVGCGLRQTEATMANVEYAITGVNRVESLNFHVPPVAYSSECRSLIFEAEKLPGGGTGMLAQRVGRFATGTGHHLGNMR